MTDKDKDRIKSAIRHIKSSVDIDPWAMEIAVGAMFGLLSEERKPEITDEQAIMHLQSTGWMQAHDREMYEIGLREQLADDSGSYDSLTLCEDTISRQAALDALENCEPGEELFMIKSLPSVQPKTQLSQEDATKSTTFDCISRESVYNLLRRECSTAVENHLVDKIRQLPSVQPEQRWIPVTLETLPNPNSVVVVCGKKGTWDYGTYRGWYGDINSWWWKKNTIKHVHWWMYKTDALPEPYRGGINDE